MEKLLTLTPGKAVYVAYLALKGSGAPDARAEAIRGKLATLSSRDVVEASSIAVVLLETARDRDLGFPEARGLDRFTGGGPQQRFERELAIRTLVKLVERVRGGGF